MKKQLSWKEVGQFVGVLVDFFKIVRDTLRPMAVGIEMIPWLIGEGKQFFSETLTRLGEEFLKSQPRVRVISTTVIMVNLDSPPLLPNESFRIEYEIGSGWVKVERIGEDLYVDGRRIILQLSEGLGYELRKKFRHMDVLHPNIMCALIDHSYLIPEKWKVNENGDKRLIFFWAVVFSFIESEDALFVDCCDFNDNKWKRSGDWLELTFNSYCYAAVLEDIQEH